MRIKEQLLHLAEIWSAADGRTLARLSTIIVADGKFFDRIRQPGKDLQTETFEKFLSFFRDGANWPDGRIPQAACDLLDNFANIATGAGASPGKSPEDTDANTDAYSPAECDHLTPDAGDDAGAEDDAAAPRASAPANTKQEAA